MPKHDRPGLNIRGNSDHPDPEQRRIERILSNLAPTPFTLHVPKVLEGDYRGYGGVMKFSSVESLLQGIKFKEPERQQEIFTMKGIDALRAGRVITKSITDKSNHFIWFGGHSAQYGSLWHQLVIQSAQVAKFVQNPDAAQALMETVRYRIYHDVGPENPNTSLREPDYIQMLLWIRDSLLATRKQ